MGGCDDTKYTLFPSKKKNHQKYISYPLIHTQCLPFLTFTSNCDLRTQRLSKHSPSGPLIFIILINAKIPRPNDAFKIKFRLTQRSFLSFVFHKLVY